MANIDVFCTSATNIRHQGVRRYKLPAEQHLLSHLGGSAKAAVVILAHNSFPQMEVWVQWHKPSVGLVVASEVEPSAGARSDTLMRAAWMPLAHGSARCHLGIVRNEIQGIKAALRWYPQAAYIYVVSGDSVPTKSASYYAQPPASLTATSITGAALSSRKDLQDMPGWLYGHQWLMLLREHAEALLEAWPLYEETFTKINRLWWHPQHQHGLDSPDEQYLHTLLHLRLGAPYVAGGVTIMKEVVEKRAWSCGCGSDEHAKAYNIKQLSTLRKLLRRAYREPDTFAFRKVDSSVSVADITPALGNTFSDRPPTISPCNIRLVLVNASGDMDAALRAAEQEAPRPACGPLTLVPLAPSQQHAKLSNVNQLPSQEHSDALKPSQQAHAVYAMQQPVASTAVRRSKRSRGENLPGMQQATEQVAARTTTSVHKQNQQDSTTGRVLHGAIGVRLLHAMPPEIHLGWPVVFLQQQSRS